MYRAVYQDDRDLDESAVAECDSIDNAIDALARYFKNCPDSYNHLTSWSVYNKTGMLVLSGLKTSDRSLSH